MGQGFNRRAYRLAFWCAVGLSIAGCSTIKSWLGIDNPDYKVQAPKPVKLEVPPDLTPQAKDDHFTVPEAGSGAVSASATASKGAQPAAAAPAVAAPTPAAAPAPAPAPAVVAVAETVAPETATAHIERDGAQQWLALSLSPEAAYAGIKDYLAASDIALVRDDPQLGLIETAWSDRRAKDPEAPSPGITGILSRTFNTFLQHLSSTGLRDRYRFRIERTDDGHSLVFVTHRGLEEVYTDTTKDSTTWQPGPPAPELEAEMLQRLAVKFSGIATAPIATAGPTPTTAKPAVVPVAATEAAPNPNAVGRLVKGDKGLVVGIDLDQPFDRAWRQVGLALDRGGFTIEDRDRSKGLYFVRYIDPDYEQQQKDKQGWLKRLFGTDPQISAQQFRIAVAATDVVTHVSVQNHDGESETSATGDRIIKLLHDQMR
jgi:outer membrane protein assembly factor BamC